MPTFKSKPVEPEIIDARQFTGGVDSAKEIIDWVTTLDRNYVFADLQEDIGGVGINARVDALELYNPVYRHYLTIYTDFWAVHHQNGLWSVMTTGSLNEKYDQV